MLFYILTFRQVTTFVQTAVVVIQEKLTGKLSGSHLTPHIFLCHQSVLLTAGTSIMSFFNLLIKCLIKTTTDLIMPLLFVALLHYWILHSSSLFISTQTNTHTYVKNHLVIQTTCRALNNLLMNTARAYISYVHVCHLLSQRGFPKLLSWKKMLQSQN